MNSRILSHFKTLVFYDGLQLFIAKDQLDVSYVCLLVTNGDESDTYLCIPVSKGILQKFTSGDYDLLSLINNVETGELYYGSAKDGDLNVIPVSKIDVIPDTWLPKPGFVLTPEMIPNDMIIRESYERQRAIIHFSLNPPEANLDTKIGAERLSQAVKLMQRVVTQAYKKSLKYLDDNTRNAINRPENYELEVFTFSPGSFTVHMQTVAGVDMFEFSQVSRALEIIDKINLSTDNPDDIVQYIAGYGGHFAMAYRDLLHFIIENKTPLSYEWSAPNRADTTKRKISEMKAEPVYLELIKKSDILTEIKVITGKVDKIYVRLGKWGLISETDNKNYTGNSGLELNGIVMGGKYEFTCEEHLVEDHGTGKEYPVLELKAFRPL